MSVIDWPWSGKINAILQSEAAECGLASLAMVARHHGHKVDLVGLRQRYPTSIKGMTLKQLMAVSSDLELAPRAVRLEIEELRQLQLPAILHWDLNHYVVLESVQQRGATILDPATGRRTMSFKVLSKHFTGVALEITPTADFKPITAKVTTRITDLWSRLVNFRGPAIQVLLLSLVLQATALAAPFFIQLVIDEGIQQGDAGLLTLLFFGFAALYILQAVTRALRSWVVLCLGQSLSFQLAGNVIRHLLRLPVGYFERRHVGDILSRIGSVHPIQSLLTKGLVDTVIDAVLMVATLIIMSMLSFTLTLIVVVFTVLTLVISQIFYPALRQRTEEEIVARAQEASFLMESIRSIRAIKLHSHESIRENGWRNRSADVVTASYKASTINIALGLSEDILLGLSFVLTVYVGALQVVDQAISAGMLLAFISYRSSFSSSAMALIDQLQKWRLLAVHLERLSDVVGQKKEEIRPAPPRRLLPGPGIQLSRISFAYEGGETPVLNDINLTIKPGSFVAIVGDSGAGKTTLMRMLLGLLPPDRGNIEIDGTKLSATTMAEWRARLGAVMQDDYLLTGTFADNICFFDTQPDQSKIEEAARFARIHDDIAAMPMGYHSLIGDMGAALSSGQRQRMLLARAMYRDPDILFLDEGTANLDANTERHIADAIAALDITRIVIAHRPALVRRADVVLRVGGGKIECVRFQEPIRTSTEKFEYRGAA
jgi:ATP-binding cassette subfamily B protein RaxB